MSPSKMSARRRRGRPTPEVELTHLSVGNAMVVHAKDALTDEALALAMSVAPDPDHELVVVDLPTGSPIGVWESLAAGLPRSRQGVRLVVGGRSREATALAGQWLAERLGRTVVAPDGTVVRGAGGSLFVHSGKDSGWVRFHPGKAPQWEAKRFPRPSWDCPAVAEFFPTSSTGAAEPLPGGVWIRPVGYEAPERAGRARLINELPCQPDVLSVVLGCPGTPAITIDDVTRFCVTLPDGLLEKVRFVQYGPVRVQRLESLGQSLADALGTEVTCYTGLPVGAAREPDVFTVHDDGSLGWHAFAEQLGFQPRKEPGDPLPLARMRVYRRPIEGVPEIAPALYWYAQDAVLEVVQAGLWIRPSDHDVNAPSVRSAPLDPTGNLLVFDGATQAQSDRMRILAEDVLGRLDYSLRQVSRLVPATALGGAQLQIAGRAFAELDPAESATAAVVVEVDESAVDVSAVDVSGVERTEAIPLPAAPIGQTTEQAGPLDLSTTVSIPAPARRVAGQEAAGWTAVPPGEDGLPAIVSAGPVLGLDGRDEQATAAVPAPVLDGSVLGLAENGDSSEAALTPVTGLIAPPELVAGPALAQPAPTVALPSAAAPAFSPASFRLESAPSDPPPSTSKSAAPADTAAAEAPTAGDSAVAPAPAATGPATTAATVAATTSPSATAQPTPSSAASALLPTRGIDEERAWLRKNLGAQFGVLANTIARVLSEHPGFQGAVSRSSADVLTEAVAVRLYLSEQGAEVDRALRTATVGPHVPFARCVVAGLRRLPSHRGATVFRMSPTAEQWDMYAGQKLLTEWGFLNALTEPCAAQEGAADVLVWSMTARRTKLLEPDDNATDDRVLFVPGTSFKVLDAKPPQEGKLGQILVRELAESEIDADGRVDANRISLDELAMKSLRRCAERWAQAKPRQRVPAGSADRFQALPGLV